LNDAQALLAEVRACRDCAAVLPLGPRPVFQVHPAARLLIAGQAPGRRVHDSGVPFDDASGQRLRDWLGLDAATFYDPRRVAILPMAFCFPGTGPGGDRPPPPRCAARWREPLLRSMPVTRLTVVLGMHALRWHLPDEADADLSAAVRATRVAPVVVLPHPSPRNNRWLAQHPWFEADVLPALRERVAQALDRD